MTNTEATIDRLEQSLAALAEAQVDRLMQEVTRLSIETTRHKVFLNAIRQTLDDDTLQTDVVWFSKHTTLKDAIDCHLNNPVARGEVPLFVEVS